MIINGEEHNSLCVGIDLGTTNSVLAIVNQKPNGDLVSKVIDVPREEGAYTTIDGDGFRNVRRNTLPSFVYYRPENNYAPFVGDYAKAQYSKRPHLVAKSIKSQMGEPEAKGFSEDVPDKTPAQIASRILKHILEKTKKLNRIETIDDAVITVPANFDSAMCKATLEAAKLAGIKITNKDGSERPVLLSEPNAVIYDLVNQINNGEINVNIIDLSTPKNVLVFDLGGGTLDITIHSIKWRDASKTTVKVDEIATNRYTLLGGDDFDEMIAEVMFERYFQKCSKRNPELGENIKREKNSIMAEFRVAAEKLKIEISEAKENEDDSWGDDEDDMKHVGCHLPTGYAYDDYFLNDEVEEILAPLLGNHFVYNDYKNLSTVHDTKNIIYPILDVLSKAADKLNTNDIKVDEVILNGGMSKFYMIKERIKKFFGREPIIALDPDLSVARGAAIYHYYLHANEAALKEDMRMLGNTDVKGIGNTTEDVNTNRVRKNNIGSGLGIEFGKKILNDSLYLGVRKGALPVELIKTGQELPYKSPFMRGLKISANVPKFYIPIQRKEIDGSYRTIVKGEVRLSKAYSDDMYISFTVSMSPSKVLTMNAQVSTDYDNKCITEDINAELVIGSEGKETNNITVGNPVSTRTDKLNSFVSSGIVLRPQDELNKLMNLCDKFDYEMLHCRSVHEIAPMIKSVQEDIHRCANREDFALHIINKLKHPRSQVEYKTRLLVTARKILSAWNNNDKADLASVCMDMVNSEIRGCCRASGSKVNLLIQAIYALGFCGNDKQLAQIRKITDRKYREAMVYAFGISHTNIDWLYVKLCDDINMAKNRVSSSLQNTARGIGYALRKDIDSPVYFEYVNDVIDKLCDIILQFRYAREIVSPSVIALGWICDQRYGNNIMSQYTLDKVVRVINSSSGGKSCGVAIKMIQGEVLNEDDEKFLLEVTNKFEQI